MTKQEAKMQLGIRETDTIAEEGIRYLLGIFEERIRIWSISSSIRDKLTKDIEACKALLND